MCYAPEKIPETPVFLKSGCDSPEEVAEPPVLHLPSPGPSIMPVGQVRQFSWHYSDKHGLSDVRQKLRKNNKQINSSSFFPPSQAPLVSKVRLLRVTQKIKQQERTRAPALRTQCLGGQVARFLRPFEARPADPVRRELYRQLAEKPGIAATSGWLAPSEALPSTPAPLGPGIEECASRALPPKKGRRRTSNRQATASEN